MSEEEKEAIEIMLEDMFFWQGKSSFITRHRYKELSKKMYKDIDKLQKVIDLMAIQLSDRPLLIFKENGKLEVLEEPEKVVEHFYKKAEEENE